MAYIPLDQESKTKGIAAIDVVGARFGKSGAGLALQVALLFGGIMQNLPILVGMVFMVAALWIFGVCYLKKAQASIVAEKDENLEYQPSTLPA